MEQDLQDILHKYWNYSSFRSIQEPVIKTVLSGKDVLAIMPTGGGKSLCYQVPALYKSGLTLVITPLIALMQDQVLSLYQKNIKASAIHSGMNQFEINNIISNCVYGEMKLLYVSPERLQSSTFIKQLTELPIELIAVDEAHCISQWGHDFRPAYRRIHEIRANFIGVPILALTASATKEVVKDIQVQLGFKDGQLFQASFLRSNLSLNVLQDDNKWGRLESVLKRELGCSLIYVRNRRLTKEIASYIKGLGYDAAYYHAGMKSEDKHKMQEDWMRGKYQIMVCTNAFGMGIDKDNVRLVIHWGIPDSLEAYYQEVGRAGRDGKLSYALMLFEKADMDRLNRNFEMQFPTIKKIRQVYQALSNYFQVPININTSRPFSFELVPFCHNYGFNYLECDHVLKVLIDLGYISITQNLNQSSRLKITMTKDQIFEMRSRNESMTDVLQAFLRTYGGIFDEFQEINEKLMANRLQFTEKYLFDCLKQLHKSGHVSYAPKKKAPQLFFLKGRVDIDSLNIDPKSWNQRKKKLKIKLEAVLNYCNQEKACRNKSLLKYFGENLSIDCGNCDYCRQKNRPKPNLDAIGNKIKHNLQSESKMIVDVLAFFPESEKQIILEAIRALIAREKIRLEGNKVRWIGEL